MMLERMFVIYFAVLCCSIGVYGQQPQAIIVTGSGSVSESDGSVEVCVNVTIPNNIPSEGTEVTVSVLAGLATNEATPEDDYRPQQQTIRFTPENSSQCVSFELIQDNLVENVELMIIRIGNTDGSVMITTGQGDIITFSVEDSDSLLVGFDQRDYTVLESVSILSVCTELEMGRIAVGVNPITLSFTVITETANLNDDFMMPSLNNNFVYDHMNTATGEPQCVQFSIVNDNIIEANETFSIQLRQVPFVTFSERLTTIMIQDDDFATVVLSQDQAAVIEGNSTMNTTIDFYVVLSDDKDGIDREVIVNVSAYEISATGLNDFVLLNDLVTFPDASRKNDQKRIQVVVLGDNIIEVNEVFAINISTFFPDLIGNPSSVVVRINRDGDNICPDLENPSNGNVELTNNTVGSSAMYSCIANYMLVGPQQRNCTADLGWSDQEPLCLRICDGLDINDGNVDVGLSVEGTIANYTCDDGYRLVGAASRLCQNDGEWTDRAPVCQEIPDGTFPDGATTQAGDPNSSRNVSIGVGLAVAFLLVIAIVVTVVVIVVVVVKISRSSKRYIVNAVTSSGSKSKSKSKTKTGSSTDDLLAPEKSKTVPGPDIGEALDLNLEEVNGTSIDIDDDEADCTDC